MNADGKETNMFSKTSLYFLLLFMIVLLCGAVTACGGGGADADVDCVIGVTSTGNQYTATIELSGRAWTDLTGDQKENVVEQCIDTVVFSMENEEDNNQTHETDYELTGIDKATSQRLFTYSGKEQKTVYD